MKKQIMKIPYIFIFLACLYVLLGMAFFNTKISSNFIALIGLDCAILFALSDCRKIYEGAKNAKYRLHITLFGVLIIIFGVVLLALCFTNFCFKMIIDDYMNVLFVVITFVATGADAWINFYPPYKKHK